MTPTKQPANGLLKEIASQGESKKRALEEEANRVNNPFPVEVLGKKISSIILDLNETAKFPVDYTGSAMLSVASAAIGNSYEVYINQQWRGVPIFYMVGVGDASVNKSSPFNFAVKPLQKLDKRRHADYQMKYNEVERIEKLSTQERKDEMISIVPNKPIWEKIVIDDFTPEALMALLSFNKRGLLLHKDEIASLWASFDRYSKGSEEQFWLSVFNCNPLSVDRKGSRSIRIERPLISIMGTIQPDLLEDMAGGYRAKNGFLYRFLFAYPTGLKKEYREVDRRHSDADERWENIVNALHSIPMAIGEDGEPVPAWMRLSKEAEDIQLAWDKKNVDMTNAETSAQIKSIYGKLDIYIYRIALVLQLLYYVTGESTNTCIEASTMEAAIKLIEYYRNTALKVQGILNNENPLHGLGEIAETIYAELPEQFESKAGQLIADKHGMQRRRFFELLGRKNLFKKITHGKYAKLY